MALRGRLTAFLAQFTESATVLLGVAAGISAAIGEWQDALLIAAIIAANTVIGYVQNQRAEGAIAALRQLTQPYARLFRDGTSYDLPAIEIVPGDLVQLSVGAVVPADGRLVEAADLQLDESLLTGESLPVEKELSALEAATSLPNRSNMVFAGSAVTHGHGRVLVTATAMATELGKMARLLEETEHIKRPYSGGWPP